MFLGRYEVHHKTDGGLVKGRICSKCKKKWSLIEHWFGLNYFSVKKGRDNRQERKDKLSAKVNQGKLREGYSSWSKYLPDQAIIFAELLPKWNKPTRLLVLLGLGSLLGYFYIRFL